MFHFKKDKKTNILNIGRRIEGMYLPNIDENSSIKEKIITMFKICTIISYELTEEDLNFCNDEIDVSFDDDAKKIWLYTYKEPLKALLIGKDGINTRNLHNVLMLISLLTGDKDLEKYERYDVKVELHPSIKGKIEKISDDTKRKKEKIIMGKRKNLNINGNETDKRENNMTKSKRSKRTINLNENELVIKIKEITLSMFDSKINKKDKVEKLKKLDEELLYKLREIGDKTIYSLLRNNVSYIIDTVTLRSAEKYKIDSIIKIDKFFKEIHRLCSQKSIKEKDVVGTIAFFKKQ